MKPEKEIKQELWDKFQDYEATPQEASWEKIRVAISISDDAELRANLAKKFDNFEVEPTTDFWSKIKENIPTEDSWKAELSEKLSTYEAKPTEASWHVIESHISTEMPEKGILADNFDDFEAEPQDSSWENIKANIPSEDIWKLTLTEKLQGFEAEPQDASWNTILSGLQGKGSLKTTLTDKFASYEAEPIEESWEIIEAAIRKEKKRRGIIIPMYFRLGLAASIALLIGTFWFLSNQTDDSNLATNSPKNTDNQTVKSNSNQKQEINKISEHSELNKSTNNSKQINNSELSDISKQTNNSKFSVIPNRNKNTDNLKHINNSKFSVNSENNIINHSTDISNSVARNDSKQKNIGSSNLSQEKNKHLILEENTDNQSIANNTSISNSVSEPTNSIGEPSKNLSENLHSTANKDFQAIALNQSFQPIDFEIDLPTEAPKSEKTNNLIYTANLMPVQSYQVYTILPQTSTYIQQIGTLNALDNQRLGVQAKFGLMKPISKRNLLGATLSYTGIQQYANYQLNNGTYEIQFTDNQNYTVSSVTETVSDLQFIQALGLKVENSHLLTQRKNRIYLTGGGEAMKVLNKNQYGFYVNAAVGVEYKINNKSLWLEPTFRYGLSQSADNLNYLKIRPYQFGLNIRFNFPTAP